MEALISPIIDYFLAFVLLYKYQALFLITFGAAFALPLPSSSAIIVMSAFASQGYMNIYLVYFVALLGNVAGDATGYFLAKLYGKKFLEKIGFSGLLEAKGYKGLEEYIKSYSVSLIFLSRFITQVGPTVNVLAGLIGISYARFFTIELLGEIAYVSLYVAAGYYLGARLENSYSFYLEILTVITSIGIFTTFLQWRMHKRLKHNEVKV